MAAGRIAHQAVPDLWKADRERSRALKEMYTDEGDLPCIVRMRRLRRRMLLPSFAFCG